MRGVNAKRDIKDVFVKAGDRFHIWGKLESTFTVLAIFDPPLSSEKIYEINRILPTLPQLTDVFYG